MGNLGFSEILLIVIIAFLVLGPQKLPGLAKKAGHLYKKIIGIKSDLTSAVFEAEDSIKNNIISEKSNKAVRVKKRETKKERLISGSIYKGLTKKRK